MNPADANRLRNHIRSLNEEAVWSLLLEFFMHQDINAAKVHATGEHGMDVVAFVDSGKDVLGKGYNVLIQAKKGRLGLDRWRKEVLYQLLEAPYYDIPHANYSDHLARRVLLIVTDTATPEAQDSIKLFNRKHDITVELWELDDLIRRFDSTGFAKRKLEQITGVGQVTEDVLIPPAVGESE